MLHRTDVLCSKSFFGDELLKYSLSYVKHVSHQLKMLLGVVRRCTYGLTLQTKKMEMHLQTIFGKNRVDYSLSYAKTPFHQLKMLSGFYPEIYLQTHPTKNMEMYLWTIFW